MNTSTTSTTATTPTPLPKLVRLEQEINAEADPVKRACLRAERAGLLARQGSADLAREALASLQSEFGRQPQASVSIWMQIAQGWIAHYDGNLSASKDHLLRAHSLSAAVNSNYLQALSAAWLAHLAYAQDSFAEMAKHLKTCRHLARQDDHLIQTRLCLVLAQSYHFANRIDLAQPWYLKARNHALIEKDDAALSVLSYNMASRRSFNLVVDSLVSGQTSKDGQLTISGIQSSYSFDQLFKIPLLGSWIHMIEGMAHSARSDFKSALALYDLHLDEAMKTRFSDQIAFFKADMAWCYANTGNLEKAKNLADQAQQLVEHKMYVEDRLITRGRLAQVYLAMGNQEAAETNSSRFRQDIQELEQMRSQVVDLLSKTV